MSRTKHIGTVLLTAMMIAATAACGSDDDPATAAWTEDDLAGAGDLAVPRVTMTMNVTGAVTLEGEQTAFVSAIDGTVPQSCAEYAKGSVKDGNTIYVMGGLLDGPIGGEKVTMELWIADYAGPGSYPKEQLAAPGSQPSIAMRNQIYATWPDSTASEVVTDADGGGTWTFRELAAVGPGGLPGDAIDGTVRWTCRDR